MPNETETICGLPIDPAYCPSCPILRECQPDNKPLCCLHANCLSAGQCTCGDYYD